jgi:hypothetical protein
MAAVDQTALEVQNDLPGFVHKAQGYVGSPDASDTFTAADITLTLGFKVRYFCIINVTDGIKLEWYEGMNYGDYLQSLRTGPTAMTLETDNAIEVNQLDADGNAQEGVVFIDVSVADAITSNDFSVWYARG